MSSRAQLERELAIQALRDAQAKAENLAAGFGKKLGPVNAVSTGQLRNISRAVGLAPAENAAGSRTAPQAKDFYGVESLRYTQSVDVIYRIGK
ncbi:SIMPL domain-containing protein [Oxalobacteraceae bacterium A2-2]